MPTKSSRTLRVSNATQQWWLGPVWSVVGALIALGGYAGYRLDWFSNRVGRVQPHVATIAIAETEFELGSAEGEPDEAPPHRVRVRAFRMDTKEVTVADYQACVAARVCPIPRADLLYCNAKQPDKVLHPVNCVTYSMAETYCKWRHARLPTEAEWELAARGTDGRAYPWGNGSPVDHACFLRRRDNQQTCPAGSSVRDKSPHGVLDMAGNVSEWTSSSYCSYSDPTQCQPGVHVVRGGSWDMDDPLHARVSFRDWVEDHKHGYNLGIRCAEG